MANMVRCTASLAVFYLLTTTLLVFIPVTSTQTAEAPPSVQQQLIYVLHELFKENQGLEQILQDLLNATKSLPDNATLPPGVTLNPLVNMVLMGIKNLHNVQNTYNSTSSSHDNSTQQTGGDLMTSLNQNALLQEAISMVSKQIMDWQLDAAKRNITIANDLASMFGLVNPSAVLQKLLMSYPARSIIPNRPSGLVSDVCFRDVTDTLDSLVAAKMWAMQMLDAFGKPAAGIARGYFYFVGSYDQCYQIEPHISRGDVIGNVKQPVSRDFGTRFCRVDIPIPRSFTDSLHVDARGIQLKLTWGLCLPDTCHTSDVNGLFMLDAFKSLPLPALESSYCYEEEDISSDQSAIAAISVLSVIGSLILIGTLCDIYKSSKTSMDIDKDANVANYELTKVTDNPGEPTDHNKCEETKTEASTLGYMPHREGNCELLSISNGKMQTNNEFDKIPKVIVQERAITTSEHKQEPFLFRLFVCFSLYTNIPKLLSAKSTSGAVSCIHGIRFLSLTWVVLGHTYTYGLISQDETFTTDNLLDMLPIIQRFTFQAVIAGGFAVDTFFVLSAFLLTWIQLKETAKKKNKCTVSDGVMYYFHRFWRLTPIYMIVIMTFGCLYRYMGSGPFWPSTIWAAEYCKSNWWTNMLYVNNLVETDSQCMGWSWYLANDMQFYVISPIFLVFMYKAPVIGGVLTCMLLATGTGIAFWKEYEVNGNFLAMKSDGGAYWKEVYTVPWCRVGCWAVGMLLGLLVYKRGRKPLKSKGLTFLCWIVAAAVALTLVYSTYSENKKDGIEWTNTQRAFYEAFGRPAWGVCVAWVIFACYSKMGGLVNSLLSWNGFIPLSRLTYAAYLVHPICMMVYIFSRRTMFHVNDYNIVYLFLGHLCVTYMVAFVCSLAFEAPAMALEKLLFRRGRRS